MPHTPITATLTDADAVLGHVDQARTALPFLVNLGPDERRRMARFGEADLPDRRSAGTAAGHDGPSKPAALSCPDASTPHE